MLTSFEKAETEAVENEKIAVELEIVAEEETEQLMIDEEDLEVEVAVLELDE